MSDGSFLLAYIGPGGPELLVIMLVLLLLFGSKDAPRILRTLMDMLNKIRRTAEHFKHEVMYGDVKHAAPADDEIGEYDDFGLNTDEAEEPGSDQDDTIAKKAGSDVGERAADAEGGDVPKA